MRSLMKLLAAKPAHQVFTVLPRTGLSSSVSSSSKLYFPSFLSRHGFEALKLQGHRRFATSAPKPRKDWSPPFGPVTFLVSTVGMSSIIVVYKIFSDEIKDHPCVLEALDVMNKSLQAGSGPLSAEKGYLFWGKRDPERNEINVTFKVKTEYGRAKVNLLGYLPGSRIEGDVLSLAKKEGLPVESRLGQWTPYQLTLDFPESRERYSYNASTEEFTRGPMPEDAINVLDRWLFSLSMVGAAAKDLIQGVQSFDRESLKFDFSTMSTLCLTFGLPTLAVSAIVSSRQKTAVVRQIKAQIKGSTSLADRLGSPIKVARKHSGSVDDHVANVKLELSGSAHSGNLSVQAAKDGQTKKWKLHRASLLIDGRNKSMTVKDLHLD